MSDETRSLIQSVKSVVEQKKTLAITKANQMTETITGPSAPSE